MSHPKESIFRKVFQSTHLHSAEYRESDGSLKVRFANGREYMSGTHIHRTVWDKLRTSHSAGDYFDKHIKPYWNAYEMGSASEGNEGAD